MPSVGKRKEIQLLSPGLPFFHPPMSLVADYIDLFPILFGSNHLHSCHSQCLSCVRLHNEKDDVGLAVQVVLATLATLSPR